MYSAYKLAQEDEKSHGQLNKCRAPNATTNLWNQISSEKGRDCIKSNADSQFPSENNPDRGRTVRVFISSTFKDFYWEREALVRQVFPRLRTWCEEKNIFLIECDLRWGVPHEATEQEAILTCLEEIDRCREELQGANFFLGLIGDRYGWTPTLDEVGDRASSKFDWIEGASVTLMEILHGAIRTLSPNAFFMIRDANFYSDMNTDSLKMFKESDSLVCSNVCSLQKYIDDTFAPLGQSQHYSCTYNGIDTDPMSGRKRVKLLGLDTFSETVINFFTEKINRTFIQSAESSEDKQGSNEDDNHMVTLHGLTRSVTGLESILKQMSTLMKSDSFITLSSDVSDSSLFQFKSGSPIVCLRGPAGSGKSTAMARLILELKKEHNTLIFYHFIGSSVSSKVDENMIKRFEEFVNNEFVLDKDDSALKIDNGNVGNTFFALLQRIESMPTKKVYIVIDALDELTSQNNQLPWLPFNLPANVRCAVSSLDSPGDLWNSLSCRDIKVVSMELLDEMDSRSVAKAFFKDFGKRLDKEQMDQFILHPSSRNPLWLMQACEELRIHGDHSSLTKAISTLPDSINELNKQIIRRLILQDTSGHTKLFFQILFVSRVGIWETEVRKLVADGKDEIPQSIWHTILRGFKSFVHIESVPIPIIKFRHRIMKESVCDELFPNEEEIENLHAKLASHYETQTTLTNFHGLEMTYHLYYSHQRRKLAKSLRSRNSFFYLSSRLTRSQIMNSMRCQMTTNSIQKSNSLKICMMCANQCQGLTIWCRNQDACLFCGQSASFSKSEARVCSFHESQRFQIKDNCIVCERPCPMGNSVIARLCSLCVGLPNRCCSIVYENEHTFPNLKRLAKRTNICW